MYRIAKFEKVSFEQFEKDWLKNFPQTEDVRAVYDCIKLPKEQPQVQPVMTFMHRQMFALKRVSLL